MEDGIARTAQAFYPDYAAISLEQTKITVEGQVYTGKRTVDNSGADTVKKTVKGLKSKRTYCVRVRACQKVDGRTCYSAWSPAGTVSVKKGGYQHVRKHHPLGHRGHRLHRQPLRPGHDAG